MNKEERIKMVKAMEYIARCVNDEEEAFFWLDYGVADGDIEYADLSVSPADEENLDCYIDDVHFAELMTDFLYLMRRARKSGGLYCDGIVSN